MKINQENSKGNNVVNYFIVDGDFNEKSKTVKTFTNSDQVRNYIRDVHQKEILSYILAIIGIILTAIQTFKK